MTQFANPIRIVDNIEEAETVLAIDVANLAYRANFAYGDLLTSTQKFSGHIHGSTSMLISFLSRNLDAKNVYISFCYEGKNAKAKRLAILPAYKSNRDPNRFNPVPDVQELFWHLPGAQLSFTGKEGDDAIAWTVKQWHKTKKIVVLSGDKDLWGLLTFPNVAVYSPNRKRYITQTDIEEEFMVNHPSRLYLAKALYGDTSDFIHGVPRLPKAKIGPIIDSLSVPSPNAFYEALGKAEGLTMKTMNKLVEGAQTVLANFRVVLPDTQDVLPEEIVLQKNTEENRLRFLDILERYECRQAKEEAYFLFGEPIANLDNQPQNR